MLHPVLEAVFRRFDEAGMRWCLLRGEACLHAPRGDVDLLVDPNDAARVRRELTALRFVQLGACGRGSHAFFLSYHVPTDRWIELDIVTDLCYGPDFELQTSAAAGCLRRRRRAGLVSLLSLDDAFWTLLLHCLLDKQRLPLEQAKRLRWLAGAARAGGELAQLVARIRSRDASDLLHAARRGDVDGLERLGGELAQAWRRRRTWRARRRVLASRLLRLLERALVPLRQRGLSVAVLGPDGAGKTTLAAAIERSFPLPTRRVYMGLWQQAAANTSGLGARLVIAGCRPLQSWWRYVLAQYYRVLGRLVICDRYSYDALLPPRRPLRGIERAYVWLLGHTCPGPDLALVLDAPGTVMFRRKGEESQTALEVERQHFLALKRLPRVQIIDANRGKDAVRRDALARIWHLFLTRQTR